MRPGRIAALVIGCLLIIPSIGLLFGGGALGIGYAFGRGDDGYFDATLERVGTETVAVTAEDVALAADPGSPDWLIDSLDADVRLRATRADNIGEIFIGIAREADVDAYLAGVAHDEVTDVDENLVPEYRSHGGGDAVAPPTNEIFWVESASGPGTQELVWEATSGRWSVVVMNADGQPGVSADVNVGLKAGFLLPLALILVGAGVVLTTLSVVMIVAGAHGMRGEGAEDDQWTGEPMAGSSDQPQGMGLVAGGTTGIATPTQEDPVVLEARLEPELSRWLWLVKWLLAIPHFIVLVFLWIAFVVLTVVAGVAIVFTGRYPRGIFDFNVGVLRWAWRVSHYATTGGIGTDRYPPFSLHAEPGDPARLDIAYPVGLSRGLVFVKWLLAIPHLIIVALLAGTSVRWLAFSNDSVTFDPTGGGGVLGLLVLAAGIMLLFTGRYPPGLHDLIIGLNRWVYRVVAYVALMTDRYPPFRLDQGGASPSHPSGPDTTPHPDSPDLIQGTEPDPDPALTRS